jgi:hypothetical protein
LALAEVGSEENWLDWMRAGIGDIWLMRIEFEGGSLSLYDHSYAGVYDPS